MVQAFIKKWWVESDFKEPLKLYRRIHWYTLKPVKKFKNVFCGVPIVISLIGGCWWQRNYRTKGYYWLNWSHHFESITVAIMTCLTVTENLCHEGPRIVSTYRYHFTVLSALLTYHWICNKCITMGVTSGAGISFPSSAPEFIPSL